MRKTTLCMISLLFVAVAVLAALCMLSAPQAKAIEMARVDLNGSIVVQYGTKLVIDDSTADANGYIRGVFDPDSLLFQFNKDGTYCIVATDIYVYTDPNDAGTARQLCDAEGYVQVDSGSYYMALKSGTTYIFNAYQWTLRDYSTKSESGYVIYGLYRTSNAPCLVKPQQLRVAVDVAASTTALGDPIQTETVDEHIYLRHEYGAAVDNLQFAISQGATFGGDTLDMTVAVQGNGDNYAVGDYTTDDVTLCVKTAGDEVSTNYEVTVDPIYVRVYPKRIVVTTLDEDTYNHDAHFRQEVVHPEGLWDDATSQLFYVTTSGVGGQSVRVYFDVDVEAEQAAERDPFDATLGSPYVGIGTWAARMVGSTVDEDKEDWTAEDNAIALANYRIEANPAEGQHYSVSVLPQKITIYNRNKVDSTKITDDWVDVTDMAVTRAEYGLYYDGTPAWITIDFDGLDLRLDYEIKVQDGEEEKTVAAYLAEHTDIQSLRLAVNQEEGYKMIASVDDIHYDVKVDDSLRWYVTPQTVSFADLKDNLVGISDAYLSTDGKRGAAFATWLGGEGKNASAICLAQYAFDLGTTTRSVGMQFRDKQGVTMDVGVLEATAEGCLYPGFYALHPTLANYTFDEGIVYLRILPVATAIVVPTNAVYDGTAHSASIQYTLYDTALAGNENKMPVDVLEDPQLAQWSFALTYNGATTAIDANKRGYTVKAALHGPAAMVHNPWLAVPADANLKVAQAALTVKLTTTNLAKEYGDEVRASNLSFTPTKGYGNDRITLSCAGWDADAEPGYYAIVASATDNYDITLTDAQGEAYPRYRVRPLDAAAIQIYINGFVEDCVQTLDANGLRLVPILYYGQTLGEDVYYQYRMASLGEQENEWQDIAYNYVPDLEGGITYQVRIVARDGDYIELDANVYSPSIAVTPALTVPVLALDSVATTTRSLALYIQDYNPDYDYVLLALVAEGLTVDNEAGTITGQDVTVTLTQLLHLVLPVATVVPQNGYAVLDEAYRLVFSDTDTVAMTAEPMAQGTMYYAMAIHKTQFSQSANAPFAVYTRTAPPEIKYADLSITYNSITPPTGYAYVIYEQATSGALPIVSTNVTTSLEALGLTYEDLEADKGKLIDKDGQPRLELMPNRQYVLVVWREADEQHLLSDALCMYVRTASVGDEGYGYEGALGVVAQSTLMGLAILNLVLMVICVVRFVVVRRKSIRKYSLTGGRK